MKSTPSLSGRLLNIASLIEEQGPASPTVKKLLSAITSKLAFSRTAKASMTSEHARVIVEMFQKAVCETGNVEPITLMTSIYKDLPISLSKLSLIVELIEMRIIHCDDKRYRRVFGKDQETNFVFDKSSLIDVYIEFSNQFMSFLMNPSRNTIRKTARPFRSNREFLEHWFDFVESLFQDRDDASFAERFSSTGGASIEKREYLNDRLAMTKRKFPFQRLVEEYQLTNDEQLLTMFCLLRTLEDDGPSKPDLLKLLDKRPYDKFESSSVLSPSGKLITEGILIPVDPSPWKWAESYEIAPEIGAEILRNRCLDTNTIVNDIIGRDDLLALVKPRKTLSNMVLPATQMDVVNRAISRYRNNSHQKLCDWGIVTTNGKADGEMPGHAGRLVMLLHGPPGTGKTALAHAIAGSLGRPLITTDISKILDKWFGESEKRLSKVFLTYRQIAKRTNQLPILLLNEADQIISKRGSINQTTDRTYNHMQNILLENLETFNGILIATTNMIDNIDDAFSRRFDLKLELDRPTAKDRKRLWRKLIPPKLPSADDIDLGALAEQYDFSGGQIELVIRNTAIAVADRPESEQMVHQADLIKYANLEQHSSFDDNSNNRIGFS